MKIKLDSSLINIGLIGRGLNLLMISIVYDGEFGFVVALKRYYKNV
jgi:hypothetical protein